MGIPKRFYDDIVTRAVELNLGIVDKVHTTNNQSDTEKYSAQLIKLKPLKTILPTFKSKLTARPLLRGISDSITKGDLVLFTIIKKKVFYIGQLNTFNEPNKSPLHFYNKKMMNYGADDTSTLDKSGYSKLYPTPIGSIKKLSKRRNDILDMTPSKEVYKIWDTNTFEQGRFTDLNFEGRHGNSIRIGSRSVNPILTIHNNRLGSVEDLNQGSIISMMSVGSIDQNFTTNADFRLSVDRGRSKEDKFKLNGGNLTGEDSFFYEYSKEKYDTEDKLNKIDFDQMIIFSDRITFDARSENAGDFTVSANRNINFGAKKNFTLNNKGFSVIQSGNIYLGKEAKTKTEPMVLGSELRKLLLELVEILNKSRAITPSGPVPLVYDNGTPIASDLMKVEGLIDKLQQRTYEKDENGKDIKTKPKIDGPPFMSHYHFIEPNDRS